MGKALPGIIMSAVGLALTVIGNPLGPVLLSAGVSQVAMSVFGPNMPKPEAASSALKQPRPHRVSAYGLSRLHPAYALYETSSGGYACDAYAYHDGRANQIVGHYLGDDKVTLSGTGVNPGADGRYDSFRVRAGFNLGLPTETAFAALMSKLPGIWTANHRGDGVVTGWLTAEPVKAEHFLKVYPNGVPPMSIVAQWQLCPDPAAADPTDEAGWTWTRNPVRHFMHYKMVRERVDYATKIAPTLAYWQAAAAICDEPVPMKAGGTEPRYTSDVAHKHTDSHASVNAALLATFDGWCAPRADGALIIFAGQYYEPSVLIGPAEIIAYEWEGVGVDDDKATNEIICSYISADHDYNTVETDAWRDEGDIAERGQVLSSNLDPQVSSWRQVRFLAKRKMARTNARNRGTVTTNVAGRIVRGHRYINLDLTEAGATFFSGPVEVTSLTRNLMTGGVTFSWIEADPNVDAWNPATEEGEPAAKGDRVAPQPIATPEITAASAVFGANSAAGTTGVFISLTVTGPDRPDLTWYARTREEGAAIWGERQYSDIDPGTSVLIATEFVPTDTSVEVQVAYKVGDGRLSDWSAIEIVDTTTVGLAPSQNTAFTAAGGVGQVTGSWSNSTSGNFHHSELWAGPTANFDDAAQVGVDFTGTAGALESFTQPLAAGNHYLWTVAFSASGAASNPTGPIAVTVT